MSRATFIDAAAIAFAAALAPRTPITEDFDPKEFDAGDFATAETLPAIMDEAWKRAELLWEARGRRNAKPTVTASAVTKQAQRRKART